MSNRFYEFPVHLFASYIENISRIEAPYNMCVRMWDDLFIHVEISERINKDFPPVWDKVSVNGHYMGNRCAGIRKVSDLVLEYYQKKNAQFLERARQMEEPCDLPQ